MPLKIVDAVRKSLLSYSQIIFSAAPLKKEIDGAFLPIRFSVERLLPIILWLLVFLPMIVFPIILVLFPLLGLPWSYLLPPTP